MRVTPVLLTRTHRSPQYLEFIRQLPCLMCMTPAPSQAHHEGLGLSGFGRKPPDGHAVPLCPKCHRDRHDNGKATFWGNVNLELAMISFLISYSIALETKLKDKESAGQNQVEE